MKVLVTGGCGFIGSHLCDFLVKNKMEVVILDDLSTGSLSNLATFDELTLINANILDESARKEALQGVGIVFHLAAKTSVVESIKDPETTHEINLRGTWLIAEDAIKAGVKRMVFASSAAIYGDQRQSVLDEYLVPNPLSPYGASKAASENCLCALASCSQMDAVSLRFFNVYGPRQQPWSPYAGVIPKFVLRLLKGQPPIIRGDGEQTRDFVYVADIVRALTSVAGRKDRFSGETYNVGSGKATSVNTLVKTLSNLIGVDKDPLYEEGCQGEVRHSLADISCLMLKVGVMPKTKLEDGLKDTIAWIATNQGL